MLNIDARPGEWQPGGDANAGSVTFPSRVRRTGARRSRRQAP